MLRGRTVVVGVSGGIAAYKCCELVRWLRAREAAVIVVMTPAATQFVTPLTFQTLSGNPVVKDLWGDQAPRFDLPAAAGRRVRGRVEHVDVAEVADVVVIAPATADLLARLVHGEAPDALTAVALATPAPLLVCPSMDLEMWNRSVTRDNVRALRARGAIVIGPESGPLASGLEGPGRLASIEVIGAAVERAAERRASMSGLRVVVSAGRTEEPLDPVRVLTNRSSGRMGFALATAARDRGARVTVVAGVTSVDPPHGVQIVAAESAERMEKVMLKATRTADLVLMAAAVSDFRPARRVPGKIERAAGGKALALEPNPDILARVAQRRRPGQVLVGFALETSPNVRRARAKLRAKAVDLIVLNAVCESIGRETNRVTLVEARSARALPVLSKHEVAECILDRTLELLNRHRKQARRRRPQSARTAQRSARGARR